MVKLNHFKEVGELFGTKQLFWVNNIRLLKSLVCYLEKQTTAMQLWKSLVGYLVQKVVEWVQ